MLIVEYQGFMNQTVNYTVYTDIVGFTMMMTSATFSVHYKYIKSACINKLRSTCAKMGKN